MASGPVVQPSDPVVQPSGSSGPVVQAGASSNSGGGGYTAGQHLESDDNDHDDSDYDSGITTGATNSSTTTLSSSVRSWTYENGRRYHAYREGSYVLPNDELEQDRLDMYHHIFQLILGGKLHICPLDNPQRILDIGTGTGAWAIDMADMYPEAEVIGNDLSPIQPRWVPPNLKFEVDDAEGKWSHQLDSFDLIHLRTMSGCFKDWDEVLTQVYNHLKPGGYIEFQDFGAQLFHNSGTLPQDSTIVDWFAKIVQGAEILGRPFVIAPTLTSRLSRLGFTEITVRKETYPFSPWPKDPKLKERGKWATIGFLDSLPAYSLALFTRVLGKSKEEVDKFNEAARKEILTKGPKNRFFVEMWFVYARKPLKEDGGSGNGVHQ